jgi:CRISPR-associated exonuclease Cas4
VVEFLPDGTVYPVEYKTGPKRKWFTDDLQLAAQAMCLEDMLGRAVPKGAIFHAKSRRRREVEITAALREMAIETAEAIRVMLSSNSLPSPVNDARCKECSMKETCQPAALADPSRFKRMHQELLTVDT